MEDDLQNTVKICRTCLNEICDGEEYFSFGSTEAGAKITTFFNRLVDFLPEINPQCQDNTVLCSGCAGSINAAHKMKKKFLQTEKHIKAFTERTQCPSHTVNLLELTRQLKDEAVVINLVDENNEEELAALNEAPTTENQQNYTNSGLLNIKEEQSAEVVDCSTLVNTNPNDAAADQSNIPDSAGISDDNQVNNECNLRRSKKIRMTGKSIGRTSHFVRMIKRTIASHLKIKNKLTFNCTQCKFTTNSRLVLNNHQLRFHKKTKIYQCRLCNYSTYSKLKLKTHKITHKGRLYECHLCSFKSAVYSIVHSHKRTHQLKKSLYKCPWCDYITVQCKRFSSHLDEHHPGAIADLLLDDLIIGDLTSEANLIRNDPVDATEENVAIHQDEEQAESSVKHEDEEQVEDNEMHEGEEQDEDNGMLEDEEQDEDNGIHDDEEEVEDNGMHEDEEQDDDNGIHEDEEQDEDNGMHEDEDDVVPELDDDAQNTDEILSE